MMGESDAPRSRWPAALAKTHERQERLAEQLRNIFSDFVPSDSTPIAKKRYLDALRLAQKQQKVEASYWFTAKKFAAPVGIPLFLVGLYVCFYFFPVRKLSRDVKEGRLSEIMSKPRSQLNFFEGSMRTDIEESERILDNVVSYQAKRETEIARRSRDELSEFISKQK